MNVRACMSVLVAGVLLAAGAAWAQQDGPGGEPPMSAEEQAMMEAWQKAATPNDHHAWLMESAGTWNVEQTYWMAPGAEPATAQATVVREALLGGRVLEESFESTFMGRPYSGMGHTGYDNVTGKYWVTWMDNMSTALFTGTGECNEGRSQCTFTVSGTDPMTGGTHEMRIKAEYEDGREVHTFHESRGGEEFMSMKMVYTRADTAE